MGQKIYHDKDVEVIDISKWSKGIYFVESENQIIKVIKQ